MDAAAAATASGGPLGRGRGARTHTVARLSTIGPCGRHPRRAPAHPPQVAQDYIFSTNLKKDFILSSITQAIQLTSQMAVHGIEANRRTSLRLEVAASSFSESQQPLLLQ